MKNKFNLMNPSHLLAVGFGSGLSPIMPGTIGSLFAIPFWFLFNSYSVMTYGLIVCILFVLGCYICQKTSQDTKTHDSGHIVWDEFVGMWITLYFIPNVTFIWIMIVFFVFRFFDILKPFPIRWFDKKIKNGFGIMFDDVIAAIFSVVTLYAMQYLIN